MTQRPRSPIYSRGGVTGALAGYRAAWTGSGAAQCLYGLAYGRVFQTHGGVTELQLLPGSAAPACEKFKETRITG